MGETDTAADAKETAFAAAEHEACEQRQDKDKRRQVAAEEETTETP